MAYNCVGWHLHTLPWLSLSPRRISRQNRIVSTFQRVWSEIRRKGRVKESKSRRIPRKSPITVILILQFKQLTEGATSK